MQSDENPFCKFFNNSIKHCIFQQDYFELMYSFLASPLKNKSSDEPSIRLREMVNPLNCTILDSWAFENFALHDEPFAKAIPNFETCALVIITYEEN